MYKLQTQRTPLIALAMMGLLVGVWAGLSRLGWTLPLAQSHFPVSHGPLMVSGFLGTLVSLERAVAIRRHWTYGAPILAGLGGLSMVVGLPMWVGAVLIFIGSGFLVTLFIGVLVRERALYNVVLLIATVLWLGGNGLWLLDYPFPVLATWWAGFLILTVAGERLELTRILMHPSSVKKAFMATVTVLLAGVMLTLFEITVGWRVAGIGMLAMALWLLRYDIARLTVRKDELPRFMAVCMLAGYVWLAVAGLFGLTWGLLDGSLYDAMLHAIFLGFIFSMIFAHAPIIFPAVMGVAIPYRPAFYTHLVALHLSLLIRVVGDLGSWSMVRQWGGMLNAVALLLFVVNTAIAARSGKAHQTY